jgi:flavorubredoxin
MESLVVYDSQFGNTKTVAYAIADGLRSHGAVRIFGLDKLLPDDLGTVDLLMVGGPTQAHGISARMRQFLDVLETASGTRTVAVAFDTRLRMPELVSGSAAKAIARRLSRRGVRIFAAPESFFVTRQGPELEQGEIDRATAWARRLVNSLALSHLCAA